MVDSTTQTPKRPRSARGSTPSTESASLDDLVAGLEREPAEAPRRGGRRGAGASEPSPEPAPVPTGEPAVAEPAVAEVPDIVLSAELPLSEDDDLSAIEGEAAPRLVSIVESLLFAASKPLGVRDIRQILKEATLRQVQLAIKQLGRDLEGRGVVLAQALGGFRLRTNPENGRWVQQLLAERPTKLSRSQLESLAVIAYRQPITKPECDHIRGVDCAAVLKVLLDYDLVRIVGRKEEPGRPHLYGTTLKFLEFFNLRSLRDMPDLHEFRELTEESRAVVREHLGESALYDEREAMGQEVLDWSGVPGGDSGADEQALADDLAAHDGAPAEANHAADDGDDAVDDAVDDAANDGGPSAAAADSDDEPVHDDEPAGEPDANPETTADDGDAAADDDGGDR